LLATAGPRLRRVARRVSICPDDAEDALQRASLLLLTKAPAIDRGRLAAWMTVVTRREALAVRRARVAASTRRRSMRRPRTSPGPPSAPSGPSASSRRSSRWQR
jgi:DNA-directed RNA polymerase specialized sigma24 family protein